MKADRFIRPSMLTAAVLEQCESGCHATIGIQLDDGRAWALDREDALPFVASMSDPRLATPIGHC